MADQHLLRPPGASLPLLPFPPSNAASPATSPPSQGLRGRLGFRNWRRAQSSPGPTSTRLSRSRSPDASRGKGELGLNLLHEPAEPRVDFIFVHGLGGGSRKTWSIAPQDPWFFWPREWLPFTPGFKHVRIHSFGYDSEWAKSGQSSLTIHDFGQALLSDIYNSAALKRNGDTPIILVAHSMGGLVAKKAYLIASRDPKFRSIASRIHTIYFLATPHRGADSASLVTTLMTLTINSPKAFVKELLPGSGTLQGINDEFRHVCKDLQLWSFFEGSSTSVGPTSRVIVDKDSAVLGLPGEHVRYLAADHRGVCKFESPTDTNFQTLLGCFNTTINSIEQSHLSQQNASYLSEMKTISDALDGAQRPEADLFATTTKLESGSCQWLTENEDFQRWSHFATHHDDDNDELIDPLDTTTQRHGPRFVWLHGPPGSGKSVAAGHVVQVLQSNNMDCSYFFFKDRDYARSSVTHLLQSMAFQMAESSFEIRQKLLAMAKSGELAAATSSHDPTLIWNSIFVGCVFRVPFSTQFWVIDALDECPSRAMAPFVQMLARIDSAVRLQVFVTSRPNGHVERFFNQEKILRVEMRAGQLGSERDIESFIARRLSAEARAANNNKAMVADILAKSNGNFLWASLIMTQLEEVASVEKMAYVIDRVPPEMTGLYRDIVQTIEGSPNADLAQCILKWAVCAPQPLTADELREAVRLDINQTIQMTEKLPHICGNLITIDSSSRLQLMHQTVKQYLTEPDPETRIAYINCPGSHARLAAVCLDHLNSKNFNPPRSRKVLASTTSSGSTSAFDWYASMHFSYHLAHSDLFCPSTSPSGRLLSMLSAFTNTNVLTWVERMAASRRLTPLTQALQYLKTYLTRQLQTVSPLDPEYQQVDAFTGDLARLMTNFGVSLLDVPASVHFLIPPLCPTSTTIYKRFGKRSRQSVLCQSNETWDDRIFCQIFPADPMSITCNNQHLALGLANRTVMVYKSSTFELVGSLQHGEPVHKIASTDVLPNLIASCSPRKLVLWDMGGAAADRRRWTVTLRALAMAVGFSSKADKIYVVGRDGKVLTFSVANGALLDNTHLSAESSDSEADGQEAQKGGRRNRFISAHIVQISPELDLVAVAYRASHLFISYLGDGERFGSFEKQTFEGEQLVPHVVHIEFNPIEDLSLMAVAYQGGDLVTVDPFTCLQRQSVHHPTSALASSPDGRTLAAAGDDAVITLFAFDTLVPLYRIAALEMQVSGLVFAPSGRRVFDMRGRTCNAWEPAALVRKHLMDDSSSEADSESQGHSYGYSHSGYGPRYGEADSESQGHSYGYSYSGYGPLYGEAGGTRSTSSALPPTNELRYTRTFDPNKAITAVEQAGDSSYMFCGRQDGSISVYDVNKGIAVQDLLFHGKGAGSIRHLAWSAQAKILFSVDGSSCVATRLTPPTGSSSSGGGGWMWKAGGEEFRRSISSSITVQVTQVLISVDGLSVLLPSSDREVLLWDGKADGDRKVGDAKGSSESSFKTYSFPPAMEGEQSWWLPHPTDGTRLVRCTTAGALHIFRWKDLEQETPPGVGIPIRLPPGTQLSTQWFYSRRGGQVDVLLVQALAAENSNNNKLLLAIDTSSIQASSTEVVVMGASWDGSTSNEAGDHDNSDRNNDTNNSKQRGRGPRLEDNIKVVIGLYRSSLYFLSIRGWVCSVPAKQLLAGAGTTSPYYSRHFFVPSSWMAPGGGPDDTIARVVSKTSVALVYRDELVVFHNFLDFEQRFDFSEQQF